MGIGGEGRGGVVIERVSTVLDKNKRGQKKI